MLQQAECDGMTAVNAKISVGAEGQIRPIFLTISPV